MPDVVVVQYLNEGGLHSYRFNDPALARETLCVVESEHGLRLARVIHSRQSLPEARVQNLRTVLRVASARDLEQQRGNERREQEAYRLCRQKVDEKKLAMKLVDVVYTLDGRKAVFFFTAENRVDFRELVKELAQALKVKIEMRQIGVRDEARRLGGVGGCGKQLCCCSFLKDFVSVSIRMAKDQNLSLNPTKVSGLCGRLMCCLAYEYDGPKDRKKKPATGAEPAPRDAAQPQGAEAGPGGAPPAGAPPAGAPPVGAPHSGGYRPGSRPPHRSDRGPRDGQRGFHPSRPHRPSTPR